MTLPVGDDASIVVALVCLKTGVVLADLKVLHARESYERLAEAVPELFGTSLRSDLGATFARLGSDRRGETFHEMVFMSARSAHVVQRLRGRPDQAVIAVGSTADQLGLMLSCVRARALSLEAEYER